MLFRWVLGKPLSESMSTARAEEMGRLAARLHEHAAATAPQEAPSVLVADRVLYWRVENRLGALASSGSLISEAMDRAGCVLAEVWADPPHRPHLIHGDLTPNNVMVSEGSTVPIDFQDLVWGLEMQDLAISLSSFGRFDEAEALRERFRIGYSAVRPWPELDPKTLRALVVARLLHQLNLALTLRKAGLDRFVTRAEALIGEWMA